jgi:hypothetical protein
LSREASQTQPIPEAIVPRQQRRLVCQYDPVVEAIAVDIENLQKKSGGAGTCLNTLSCMCFVVNRSVKQHAPRPLRRGMDCHPLAGEASEPRRSINEEHLLSLAAPGPGLVWRGVSQGMQAASLGAEGVAWITERRRCGASDGRGRGLANPGGENKAPVGCNSCSTRGGLAGDIMPDH